MSKNEKGECMIRLVASDIDGTMIGEKNKMTE